MPLEQTRRARGLVSPSTGSATTSSIHPPPADLTDIVEYFWTTRWSYPEGDGHEVQMLSDPSVHLVLEPGAERIVGVYTRLWKRRVEGDSTIHAAKLRPGAIPALFDVSAHTLANRTLPWTAFWPLPASGDPLQRLAEHLRTHRRPASLEAVRAVELARTNPALNTVAALADALRTHPRRLQRLFKAEVGGSPKWVLLRFRLQEAAQRVELGRAVNLADLAYELGYADQAHLARDFKAAVGESLRAFENRLHGR